jgi:hypothetical protein
MANTITINAAIVCDDYREERGGKGIIIGIYGNVIVFNQFPANFKFFMCLLGHAQGNGAVNVKVEVLDIGGTVTESSETQIEMTRDPASPKGHVDTLIALAVGPVKIEGEGTLVLKAKPNSAKQWKVVAQKDIRASSVAPS